ncbi:hypothetical protein C7999DRAFT_31334 [Corynascus novoguineensis]|uniref:Protein kinase domain-containing protein n=1 Tax=Corynascus novoguineensis TaxID=1126955 RepID=A0AAN7CW52_9PEZI|nr:hypothetical protein C7999DRAFT_31334 [Corynascus novoguineensis]
MDTPPTTDQVTPAPTSSLSSSFSSHPEQLGALLGSILGFAFLVLLTCCLVSFRRRQLRQRKREARAYRRYYYGHEDDEESDVVRVQSTVRHSTPYWNLHYYGSRRDTGAGTGIKTSTWTTVPPPILNFIDALSGFHSLGIVHQDLQIDNYILIQDGSRLVVCDLESRWGQRAAPKIAFEGGVADSG